MRKYGPIRKFLIRKGPFPYSLFLILYFLFSLVANAQKKEVFQSADSLKTVTTKIDSTAEGVKVKKTRVYDPRKAALYSAVLPGLGQIYNKKYWKLPIVYGALGISGSVFFFNLTNYKNTRFAYRVKYNMRVNHTDSLLYPKIKRQLIPFSEESLRSYRDRFRRDIDYSAIFFVLLWGLNVVDASVDAHLKAFDVSPDLALKFKAGYSEMAGTSGFGLVLQIGKKPTSLLPSRF